MFVVTHALSPVVLAGAVDAYRLEVTGERWLRRRQYVGIAVAGALPDLLWPHLSLAARYSSPTHTVWFLGVVAVVAALWGGRFVDGRRPGLAATLMTLACGWHLFCDAIANGICWGYPFSRDVIGVKLVPYRWWLGLDFICLVVTASLAAWLRWRDARIRGVL